MIRNFRWLPVEFRIRSQILLLMKKRCTWKENGRGPACWPTVRWSLKENMRLGICRLTRWPQGVKAWSPPASIFSISAWNFPASRGSMKFWSKSTFRKQLDIKNLLESITNTRRIEPKLAALTVTGVTISRTQTPFIFRMQTTQILPRISEELTVGMSVWWPMTTAAHSET